MGLFEEPRKTRTTVYLDPDHLEAIERIQELAGNGANRSQVVRFALERGLRGLEVRLRREAGEQELEEAREHKRLAEAGIANTPPGWARDAAEGEIGELRDFAKDCDDITEDEEALWLYRVNKRAWELVEDDERPATTD